MFENDKENEFINNIKVVFISIINADTGGK